MFDESLKGWRERWLHWWARHFIRNHVLVAIGLAAYNLLLVYLWTNYALVFKRTPLGSFVTVLASTYIFLGWMVPLRYAEEYPDQLLKTERWLPRLFIITFAAYIISIFLSPQSSDFAPAALGLTWVVFIFPCLMIFRGSYPRALARMRILERISGISQQTRLGHDGIIKTKIQLFRAAIRLYNRDLVGSYGFRIRDVERFCKPLLLQSLSRNEPQTDLRLDVDGLISSMKQGPIEFLKALKVMKGEQVETKERLYDDIQIEPTYLQVLVKYSPTAVAVVGTIVGVIANIYWLAGR